MIVLDPGHGGEEPNNFRIAPNGEREGEINLKVALLLSKKLRTNNVEHRLTRSSDKAVALKDRILNLQKNDLFISIHHNSYDPPEREASFPIVYVHGAENSDVGKSLLSSFEYYHPRKGSCIDDRAIFDEGLFVLKNAPCKSVLGEFDFFSSNSHLRVDFYESEANAYLEFILNFLKGKTLEPSSITERDIEKQEQCFKFSKPSWFPFLKSLNLAEFEKLPRQQKLCPILGRLSKIPHYYA